MIQTAAIHFKLIFWHIIITVFTYVGIGFIASFFNLEMNRIVAVIYLVSVVFFYVWSGYIATDKSKNFSLKNYYIVVLVGLIIWLAAYLTSPSTLDFKDGSVRSWWVSRIYTAGIEGPLRSNGFSIPLNSVKHEFGMICILTLIPSFLQACGGFLKIKRQKQ